MSHHHNVVGTIHYACKFCQWQLIKERFYDIYENDLNVFYTVSTTIQQTTMWWLSTEEVTAAAPLRRVPKCLNQARIGSSWWRDKTSSYAASLDTVNLGWRLLLMPHNLMMGLHISLVYLLLIRVFLLCCDCKISSFLSVTLFHFLHIIFVVDLGYVMQPYLLV